VCAVLVPSLVAVSVPACGEDSGGSVAGGDDARHEQANTQASRVFSGYRDTVASMNVAWDKLYLRDDVYGWDTAMQYEIPQTLDVLGLELEKLLALEKELGGESPGTLLQGVKTQDFGLVSGTLAVLTLGSLIAWYKSTKGKVQQQAADKAAAVKKCYDALYKKCMAEENNHTICHNLATKQCEATQFHNGVSAVTEGVTIAVTEAGKKGLEEGAKTLLPVLKIPGINPSKVKTLVDYGSGVNDAVETGKMLGQTEACKTSTPGQEPQRILLAEDGSALVDFADGCSFYLGSTESGTFEGIPEGNWDLTLYTPGDSRASVGGVSLQGGQERSVTFKKRKLKMSLSKDCLDAYDHYCQKLPGMSCAGELMDSATARIEQHCGAGSARLIQGGMDACKAGQACPAAATLASAPGGTPGGCTEGTPQTFSFSGSLDVDGRQAQMELTFQGRKVTGKMTGGPVCEPNMQLPRTEITFTGMLQGNWDGSGSVSGSWTGPDLSCSGAPMAGYPAQGRVSIWQQGSTVYLSRNVGGGRWTFQGSNTYAPKCP
jgi:hypothetical protein